MKCQALFSQKNNNNKKILKCLKTSLVFKIFWLKNVHSFAVVTGALKVKLYMYTV